jgi:hypothetical protein
LSAARDLSSRFCAFIRTNSNKKRNLQVEKNVLPLWQATHAMFLVFVCLWREKTRLLKSFKRSTRVNRVSSEKVIKTIHKSAIPTLVFPCKAFRFDAFRAWEHQNGTKKQKKREEKRKKFIQPIFAVKC